MILLNPILLGGLALVVIPVLLHLLLRSKPKQLLFPALRLIQLRRMKNVQRMRLRHLWLLLLRMLVIGLLVLALARPSVPAANYGLSGSEIARLVGIGVICLAAWLGLEYLWKRSRLPRNEMAYRRTWAAWSIGLTALLLFVVLFAWPYAVRIAASITAPTIAADSSIPVTAVLLFDTSLSMEYQFEGKNRLDAARGIAQEHLKTLPAGSRLAIADSANDAPLRFQSDLNQLQTRLAALSIQPSSRSLTDRLEQALETHLADRERQSTGAGGPQSLREVYLFTDLSASAWRLDEAPRLMQLLTDLNEVNLYLIDVGIETPQNIGVVDLSLSDQTLPQGGELQIRGTLRGTGVPESDRTVELLLTDETGRLVKQGQSNLKLQSGTDVTAQFTVRQLTGPTRQGELRIVGSDPFTADDVRYFSIRVQTPPQILIVSSTASSAQFLMEALAPEELVKLGRARYRCRFATPTQLAAQPLSDYQAVCLVNVPDPGTAEWNRLADYVRQGGGLLVVLGAQIRHAAYLSPAARDLLPAELKAQLSFRPPEFLDLQDLTHPVLKKFEDWGTAELAGVEMLKYWSVAPTADATIISRFTDLRKSPALLDRIVGAGRVMMFTSAWDRGGWNDLPASGWSFLALADQVMRYLTRAGESRWNFAIGDDLAVPLKLDSPLRATRRSLLSSGATTTEGTTTEGATVERRSSDPAGTAPGAALPVGNAAPPEAPPAGQQVAADQRPEQLLLRKPGLQQLRVLVPEATAEVLLTSLDQLGNYRLLGAEPDSRFDLGFSLNMDGAESDFRKLTTDELVKRLGKDRYNLARNIEGLKREVRAGRIGREVFPWLLTLLILLFVGEHLVANRFYENPGEIARVTARKPSEQTSAASSTVTTSA